MADISLTDKRSPDAQVTVKGVIVDAIYHRELGQIAVLLKLPDESRKSIILSKANFTYGGRSHDRVSPEEIDSELAKTAQAFKGARGRTISLIIYENQA
jgi:hypothetical protein